MKRFIALTAMVSCSLFAGELVKNGNFDQDKKGGILTGTVPAEWQDNSGCWAQVDGDGFTDTFSVKFKAKKDGKGELRQTVDCKPGTGYQLKAALKSEGAVPVIRILEASGKALAVLKGDKNTWQEYTAKFRTGSKTKKITVAVSAEGNEGSAKVDEISIIPLKSVKAKEAQNLFAPPKGTVNLALNKTYTLAPRPRYSHTRDDDDIIQLTDGKYTRGHFWTQKSTVGWSKQRMVQVMMDLGKVEPIQGFLYSCAGYPQGSVGYPVSIEIFTSKDQKEWYYLGDLWSKSLQEVGKPDLSRYALYRAASMNMPTCARWICFQIKLSLRYTFADEIEVFKGDDKLLDAPPAGKKVASPANSFASSEFAEHFRNDADAILAAAKILPADQQKQLAQDFDKLLKGSDKFQRPPNNEFIPLLPLHPVQERIFAKNNVVLNALGYTKPMFWQNCRWDNLHPIAVPPKGSTPEAVVVDMMPGEVRAETLNLLNPTDKVIDYKVTVEGLPAEANLDCREVLFMDTKQNEYVASALKPGQGNSVTVKVHPGMSRQIWFSFVKPALKAGLYKGTVKATAEGAPTVEIPLHLAISKVKFPERPRLHIGGWDYLDAGGNYYRTPGNVKSNMATMRSIYLDSPWANRGVLPSGAKYDKAGHLLNPDSLNYTRWDKWTGLWPDARLYCLHLSVRKIKWSGETPGTERFALMVKEYMTAFAKHLRASKKIQPEQVVFLLVDEPRSHEYDEAFITWAKAIKAADAGFVLVEDPIYADPTKALPGLFDYSDILCPNYVYQLAAGDPMRDFYLKQRDRGKKLWLYACSGPSRLLDPAAYYRAQEWQCFNFGAEGAFYWAFGCGGGIGDSWHAYAQPGFEYSPYYVSKTDTMAAKQSEGIREGVEDYEYFSMLRDRIAELKKAGKSSPDIEAAEKLLNEEVNSVLVRYYTVPENTKRFNWIAGAIRWKTDRDRDLMDQIRIKALRLLEKLQ